MFSLTSQLSVWFLLTQKLFFLVNGDINVLLPGGIAAFRMIEDQRSCFSLESAATTNFKEDANPFKHKGFSCKC